MNVFFIFELMFVYFKFEREKKKNFFFYIFEVLVNIFGPLVANYFNNISEFKWRVLRAKFGLSKLKIVLISG